MGGRRAVSIRDALGTSRSFPKLERDLDQGLSKQDPRAVSQAASDLAKRAIPATELTSHLRLFVPFIQKQLGEAPDRDVRSDVRREWARLKKTHDIHVSEAVNNSLVQAVISFLKARSG